MSRETAVIREAVERCNADPFFIERFQYNVNGTIQPELKESFWFELVMALLSSQQRGTPESRVEQFRLVNAFPLTVQAYATLNDDEVDTALSHFRFHQKITKQLRMNYEWLFGKSDGWSILFSQLQGLLIQRNQAADPSHKVLERTVSRLLAEHLEGIGPKQSRNLLQSIGLTRYEIPLDSRVVGWLRENLGWQIYMQELSNDDSYEDLLDRVQASCEAAGVLPTVFDAAAFIVGSTMNSAKSPTTCIGYVNRNGQVVIRNTGLPGTDKNQSIYQLGCSHCGHVYGANGSDIFERKCPNWQDGAKGLPYE
jgi:hypothetical protein